MMDVSIEVDEALLERAREAGLDLSAVMIDALQELLASERAPPDPEGRDPPPVR